MGITEQARAQRMRDRRRRLLALPLQAQGTVRPEPATRAEGRELALILGRAR